jgi:hypothetical protein
MATARQWLVETSLLYNDKMKHVFMATANNKGIKYSISGPLEASWSRDSESKCRVRDREKVSEH